MTGPERTSSTRFLPVDAGGDVGPDYAMNCTSGRWCYPMIIAVLCPPDLVLLVRSGPVIRDLGGSVRIWGDNGPVLISYFYDGAVPV